MSMAPSSHLDSQLVEMRVQVDLPQDTALQYANTAAAPGGAAQPISAPLPVLTCMLHTDFSSHVQAALCRPWQVWLVGTEVTCDDQWDRLNIPSTETANSTGMLHKNHTEHVVLRSSILHDVICLLARRQDFCNVMWLMSKIRPVCHPGDKAQALGADHKPDLSDQLAGHILQSATSRSTCYLDAGRPM